MLGSNVHMGENDDVGEKARQLEKDLRSHKANLSQAQGYAEKMNLQMSAWQQMPSSPTKRP